MSGASTAAAPPRLVIASRESALAMWQARHVAARLAELYPAASIEIAGMTTEGDRRLDASLAAIGGKGLFVKELERALETGAADLAAHSMKDVPVELPQGFVLAAVMARADPRDAFCSNRHAGPAALPRGARVGTSSLRRACLLRARYPGLDVRPLRGNVATRLARLDAGDFDAIILAAAGLDRLGLSNRVAAMLDPEESLPAPGQGALGLECTAARSEVREWLAPLNHSETALCVAAERALSLALAGSCNVPLGAYAELTRSGIRLRAFVGAPDGSRVLEAERTGPASEPEALGRALAEALLSRGAAEILAALGEPHARR